MKRKSEKRSLENSSYIDELAYNPAMQIGTDRAFYQSAYLWIGQVRSLYAQVVTRGCDMYLGLPQREWTQDVPRELAAEVMADAFSAGNFNDRAAEHAVGAVMMNAKTAGEGMSRNILGNYYRYVRKRVRATYPWARSPLWIPAFCIYFAAQRYVRVLTGKRKKVRLRDAIQTARTRQALIQKLRLYQ